MPHGNCFVSHHAPECPDKKKTEMKVIPDFVILIRYLKVILEFVILVRDLMTKTEWELVCGILTVVDFLCFHIRLKKHVKTRVCVN